ncbi:MAG: hypothetical protein M0Z46_16420 [Actinomycetota bacterium]|nr:hypothetical protein [Actinomycetota bacterium]
MSDPTPTSEPTDGMDALRQRVERRRRVVPPPRHSPKPAEAEAGGEPAEEPSIEGAPASRPARRPRTPAPTKTPRLEAAAERTGSSEPEPSPPASPGRDTTPTPTTAPAGRGGELAEIVLGGPPERFVQLGVRVRATFDERLDELVYQFRRQGVRTSKSELVELLLSDLPPEPDNDLRARLASFRRHAPRLGL